MTTPRSVTLIRALVALNGVIWVLLAAVGLLRNSTVSTTMLIVYLLALANACVLLWLAWRLGMPSRLVYSFALAVILVNAVLSITDELGLADIAVLCLNLVTFCLLLAARSYYLTRQKR